MKVVKKGEVVMRVLDEEAHVLVQVHGYKYCPKHEFKTQQKANKSNA